MHTQSTNITLSLRSHVFIKQVYNSSPERWPPIHLVKMQKKVEVDPLKAPILNFDVQLMLQTKQVKLSQGLNSTSLQLQTWPILVKESKLFCKNLKHSDSVIKMMMNKIAFTTFSITEYGTICMIKGNPGTYWRPSCFSHSVSQRQSLNFSRQSCLKKHFIFKDWACLKTAL